MSITQKSIKLLWSASGGRCAFEGCWERLCYAEAGDRAPFTLGQMAHICGDEPGSNRHDPAQTQVERDDYDNLILLCPNHHVLIDRKENEAAYPVEALRAMKAAHGAKVLQKLDAAEKPGKADVARSVVMLLDENRISWENYGPNSELAKNDPLNEAVFAVWLSERLSTIVPNNRKIVDLIGSNRAVFDAADQKPIAAFMLHVRSYEKWVADEVPYAAVLRFPKEFEAMIREAADGG